MNTNDKLQDIVLVMGDAYYFIKFRIQVELIERRASEGDLLAKEFMERFDTIHRLAAVCLK